MEVEQEVGGWANLAPLRGKKKNVGPNGTQTLIGGGPMRSNGLLVDYYIINCDIRWTPNKDNSGLKLPTMTRTDFHSWSGLDCKLGAFVARYLSTNKPGNGINVMEKVAKEEISGNGDFAVMDYSPALNRTPIHN
ncbi:disease resistance protein [Striga asiatica]|uniref:Disease resistance protein n=1 Tax=Striga asiatica TaxID=4170 RepID=A0A5A7PRK6_STRAF|nr:disease resistance protein [Striga asiatica]